MPYNYKSYQEEERKRKLLLTGGVLATIGLLANRKTRGAIIHTALSAAEAIGNSKYRDNLPRKLSTTVRADEFETLITRQVYGSLKSAHIARSVQSRLTFVLSNRGGSYAIDEARRISERLTNTGAFSTFLSNKSFDTSALFQDKEVRALLGSELTGSRRDVIQKQLAGAFGSVKSKQAQAYITARAKLVNDELLTAYQQGIQEQINNTAQHPLLELTHTLARRAGLRVSPKLNVGLRRANLGELSANSVEAQQSLNKIEALGNFTAGRPDLEKLRVDNIYSFEGKQYDLRKFFFLGEQIRDSFINHFQVPLAPNALGVNPLQLFPWMHGNLNRDYAFIGRHSLDPGIKGLLGINRSGHLGVDVAKVHEDWISYDPMQILYPRRINGQLEAPKISSHDLDATIKAGTTGAIARSRRQRELAMRAKEEGRPLSVEGFLPDAESGLLSKIKSTFTKFNKDSDWSPNLFRRTVETTNPGDIPIEDVRRIAGFLTTPTIAPGLLPVLFESNNAQLRNIFGKPAVDSLIKSGDTPEGIYDFFRHLSDRVYGPASAPLDYQQVAINEGRLLSADLVEKLKSLRAGEATTLGRKEFASDPTLIGLGYSFTGQPEHKFGLDILRRSVIAEVVAQDVKVGQSLLTNQSLEQTSTLWNDILAANRGSASHISSTAVSRAGTVSTKELEEAKEIIYGYKLAAVLRQGATGQPMDTVASEVVQIIQNNPDLQTSIASAIDKRSSLFSAFLELNEENLRTSELVVRRSTSFITALNRNLAAGSDGLSSVLSATSQTLKQYGALFTGSGRETTSATLHAEFFIRRINDLLTDVEVPWVGKKGVKLASLGLPEQDLGSAWDIAKNIFLKRVLPIYAGVQTYRYLDYQSDELGIPGPSDIYAGVRSAIGYDRASLFGQAILGQRRSLFVGLDKYISDRNVEEEKEHQKSGYEPVRKGRFWLIGSRTPFYGDKVDYWLPSAVNAARSNWAEAENTGISGDSYWAHSFLPNPNNLFLGPLTAMLDPNWFERKYSSGPNPSRPYPVSGPLFDTNTIHGSILNPILSPIIKPQHALHSRYVPISEGGSLKHSQVLKLNRQLKNPVNDRGLELLLNPEEGEDESRSRTTVNTLKSTPGLINYAALGGNEIGPTLGYSTGAGHMALKSIPAAAFNFQLFNGGGAYGSSRGGGSGGGGSFGGGGSYGGTNTGTQTFHYLSKGHLERINRAMRSGYGGGTKVTASKLRSQLAENYVYNENDLANLSSQSRAEAIWKGATDVAGLYGWLAEKVIPTNSQSLIMASSMDAQSSSQAFYEMNLGGLGGSLSEVGRRFIPRRGRREIWNPVPNNMPGWLPGEDYFINFQRGDPYKLVARGLLRLPGEAYERLHPDLRLMKSRASALGKSVEEMMQSMLHIGSPMSKHGESITELGSDIHKIMQDKWREMGVLIGAEYEVYNKKYDISGHYDAVLQTSTGKQVTDIKTVSAKRFAEAQKNGALPEHVAQLNFYMHELGIKRGFITYVNRDALLNEGEVSTFMAPVNYSEAEFNKNIAKVQEARSKLTKLINKGILHRGDLYDPVTRFEILSDVAPYSQQAQALKVYLSRQNESKDLSPEDNARFQAAKERATETKKKTDIAPYRFNKVKLNRRSVVVDKILDANRILLQGSDTPIRLAGIKVTNERIENLYGKPANTAHSLAEMLYGKYGIYPGSRITIGVEGDSEKINNDVLSTQSAVIFNAKGNLNREFLATGVGEEKKNSWSSPDIVARFSESEVRVGRFWEFFSHLDTPYHTKLLRNRSPLEELERGIVFGKRSGGWDNPIRDYIYPSISAFTAKSPFLSAVGLAGFASFFIRTKKGQNKVRLAGIVIGAALSLIRAGAEVVSGTTWKPGRTRKREELEEYYDILKYLKYNALAIHEEAIAKNKEGIDIAALVNKNKALGDRRKDELRRLKDRKKALILADAERNKDKIAKINERIASLTSSRSYAKLGSHATKALLYRQLADSTLYAVEPGVTSFQSVYAAFPKYKRELLQGFIADSSKAEKRRIYDLLPRHEKTALGKALNVPESRIPKRRRLDDYFKTHTLPDRDWKGWDPAVNLDDLHMLSIDAEGLDPMDSGYFQLQVDDAASRHSTVPLPVLRGTSAQVKNTLHDVLRGHNMRTLRIAVNVEPSKGDRDTVDINLKVARRNEAELKRILGM